MPRVKRANKITKTTDGFVHGEIIAVEEVDNQYGGTQFEWSIGVDTKKGTTTIMRFWTGTIINDVKSYYPSEDSDAQYNQLTQLCLQLGLLDEGLLNSDQEIDFDLSEKLDGRKVSFTTKPSRKRRALEEVDLSTLKLVD